MNSTAQDGEYKLWYPEKSVYLNIYCHSMTGNPTEYLALPAGAASNYIHKGVPSNARNWGRQCLGKFSKVRLVLSNPIKILRSDITFMEKDDPNCNPLTPHHPGAMIGYGSAAGCNNGNWPSGYFKIDLSGTQYRIPSNVTWINTGYRKRMEQYVKSENGKTVSARCGGYCGACNPSSGEYIPLDLTGRNLYLLHNIRH